MAGTDIDVVRPGCRVTYRDGGEEKTVAIYDDAHPRQDSTGWLSALAPLAQALMGLSVHDMVEFSAHPVLPKRVLVVVAIEEAR